MTYPFYQHAGISIYHGDCREILASLDAHSLDAVCTDPPYDLTSISKRFGTAGSAAAHYGTDGLFQRKARGFMNKQWDGTGVAFDPATWETVARVMKPGAYLLAFGGPRTYHRLACAIEDAGFILRDCLMWLYGSGFPKSLNFDGGYGTALKPSYEPIVLAQKPVDKTYAENWDTWACGLLNIDACRIGTDSTMRSNRAEMGYHGGNKAPEYTTGSADGRWPTNVLFDEEAAALLDQQSGPRKAGGTIRGDELSRPAQHGIYGEFRCIPNHAYNDSGGASRFFFVAKASRSERDEGVEGLPERSGGELTGRRDGSAGLQSPRAGAGRTSGGKNTHPTVKPLALMKQLLTLIVPPGGIVADPFMGSGSTLVAAKHLGMRALGFDAEEEYCTIAQARLRQDTLLADWEHV